ncbi:DUF3306 domain-containing protein [Ferrovibrio terrae]|uniref:DUF3306 domain-containing protein n=1 Tax=Ferrovibrio terrae TaxID=2594003 RepID=A0A516H6W8_9PROT|nr:DUF3306 domain-containing protein [Ferrovibrio terrae]QDO99492.1 DUF3306 domain-containing protein [Ferrovibrio terrae]
MTAGRDKPDDLATEGEGSGFLSRWSRRKAEVREQERVQPPASDSAEPAVAPEAEAEFDPATLPPIDSLTAESDFSVFLKKGVPTALRTAALRKLWVTEPSVVNYKALVEYNWDFTAPGYGELLPTDDVAKMAKHIFSGFSQEPKPEDAPQQSEIDPGQQPQDPQQALPAPEEQPVAEIQGEPARAEPVADAPAAPAPRRRHGGALPS